MIIVEGPDLAGKTTFCQNLILHLGKPWKYAHLSRPGADFPGYDALMRKHVVADRFHISAFVYGLGRGENPAESLTPAEYQRVQAKLALQNAITIVLLPSEKAIWERWREGEMYDLPTVLRVRNYYDDFINGRLTDYPPAVDFVIDTTMFVDQTAGFNAIKDRNK